MLQNVCSAGKFLNGYLDGDAPRSPRWPKGWSHFDALDDASVFRLFDPCFVLNGGKKECFTADQDYHQVRVLGCGAGTHRQGCV